MKNLFELKNAQRVLMDGNVFREHHWAQSQDGMAILLRLHNQNGGAPWSVVQDVAFTNNIVRHSGGGFNISGPTLARPEPAIAADSDQNYLIR